MRTHFDIGLMTASCSKPAADLLQLARFWLCTFRYDTVEVESGLNVDGRNRKTKPVFVDRESASAFSVLRDI